MSLYNMVNGAQPATFFILPMLGRHPDEYPRFRDCFIGRKNTDSETDQFGIPVNKHGEEELISVYTRMGGGNRDCWEGYKDNCECAACIADKIEESSECIGRFDDVFDCTYCTFVFKVPEKFKKDFHLIKEGKIKETSKEYREILYKVYPKLSDKFDQIFK